MKYEIVPPFEWNVALVDTNSGTWSVTSDNVLYLTLDEGFVCFSCGTGAPLYLSRKHVREHDIRVKVLRPGSHMTFVQEADGLMNDPHACQIDPSAGVRHSAVMAHGSMGLLPAVPGPSERQA